MRARRTACLRLAACLLPAVAAGPLAAQTALEQRLATEPSPHRTGGGASAGPTVAAHWARYVEQLGDEARNRQRLDELRAQVGRCRSAHQQDGLPVADVAQWPARTGSTRTDIYVAAERSVAYRHAVAYALDPRDCGLLEQETSTAVVLGPQGACTVDLLKKRATGSCSASAAPSASASALAFAATAPRRRAPPAGPPPAAASKLLPRATGEQRTVAGLSCEVVTQPLDPDGGTRCQARGGDFPGWGPRPAAGATALVLESRSRRGLAFAADEAALGLSVPAALFAPQQGTGISTGGGKP